MSKSFLYAELTRRGAEAIIKLKPQSLKETAKVAFCD